MNINNLYNFKNPIRHFVDISHVIFCDEILSKGLDSFSWTAPIDFRIRKKGDKCRTLKIPNIINFYRGLEIFKGYEHFTNPSIQDPHKRLVPNLDTGDFATGVYDNQLENDFYNLCIYDNLLKLDIKAYYDRVYTHHLTFQSKQEPFLTNQNNGNTKRLNYGELCIIIFC